LTRGGAAREILHFVQDDRKKAACVQDDRQFHDDDNMIHEITSLPTPLVNDMPPLPGVQEIPLAAVISTQCGMPVEVMQPFVTDPVPLERVTVPLQLLVS
jgi:hypothetical protein